MKLILLSGGSGKRLWPLSNDSRSKQFLKILQGPQGQMESMVQRVWRQLSNADLMNRSIVATSSNQVNMIMNQLGTDTPIVIEPERRDTFPAIALAASYLHSVQGVPASETVVVMPVDPFVEDHFFNLISGLDSVLEQSSSSLALVGVRPTYPSSKYGYIITESATPDASARKVTKFHEKPTEKEAKHLIDMHNAYWNCGVFVFKLNYILSHLSANGFPIQYEQLIKQFHLLKKTSFDYEIVEKESNIAMIPYDGGWKDLGTWNTITEEMQSKQIGIGKMSEDSLNSHLVNELHIPVTVLGLSDVVVVASPDGILVSDKAASPRLKEWVGSDQRPMFEEHRWGTSKVLEYGANEDGSETLTRKIFVKEGEQTGLEVHFNRFEILNVVSGVGEIYLDGKTMPIQKGFTCKIPPKTKHGIRAITDIQLVEIQDGSPLDTGDTVEFSFKWGSAVI